MVKKRAKAKKKIKPRKTRPSKKARATKTKKAFGGYSISFKGRQETLEKIFGSAPIGPSVMTKKLWAYVKLKKLAGPPGKMEYSAEEIALRVQNAIQELRQKQSQLLERTTDPGIAGYMETSAFLITALERARAELASRSPSTKLPETINRSLERMLSDLEPEERERAFRCVASYKACMREAGGVRDKILCIIALAICWAKEVIPLT